VCISESEPPLESAVWLHDSWSAASSICGIAAAICKGRSAYTFPEAGNRQCMRVHAMRSNTLQRHPERWES
jgi:hypothetical protein